MAEWVRLKMTKPDRQKSPGSTGASGGGRPSPSAIPAGGAQGSIGGLDVPGWRRAFWPVLVGLLVVFSLPLYRWGRFTLRDELYGYALMIPAVSLYLGWQRRDRLQREFQPAFGWAGGFLAAAAGFLGLYAWRRSHALMGVEETVALTMLPLLSCLGTVFALFLGRRFFTEFAFPFWFLLCTVPLPGPFRETVETWLQHGSAAVASRMFAGVGTLAEVRDMNIDLAVITLHVAPECSGIHSTLVLFCTSLLAGCLFLRTPWRRWILTGFVIPLAILRNGFRIFTIGELCVRIGPHMIKHWIHRQGGPVFFALSLVPFLLLLWLLHWTERRAQVPAWLARRQWRRRFRWLYEWPRRLTGRGRRI